MKTIVEVAKQMRRDNKRWPVLLAQVPRDQWPVMHTAEEVIEVWRSREFLVTVWRPTGISGCVRLSINITDIAEGGDATTLKDGLSWEDLMSLKRQCGRGHLDAVEVFPADEAIVNIANMRHLFVFDEKLPYVWRKK